MVIYPKNKNIRTRGYSKPQEIKWGVPVVKNGDWLATRTGKLPYMKTMFQAGPFIKQPALSGLGWSDIGLWDTIVGGGCSSIRSYRICAIPSSDAGIIAASGCGTPGVTCTTASGNAGRQYCCSQNPRTVGSSPSAPSLLSTVGTADSAIVQGYTSGKGAATTGVPSTAVTTSDESAANIRALQQHLIAQGCTLPRYGVDGRWGSETSRAVTCAGGVSALSSMFPFLPGLAAQRITTTISPSGEVIETVEQPSTLARFFDLRNPALWFSASGVLLVIFGVGYAMSRGKTSEPVERKPVKGKRKIPKTLRQRRG
jgi:hypothetical protein